MIQKSIREIGLFMAILISFTACSQASKEKEEVDPRDAFIGTYDYKTTGSADLYAAGVKLITAPLDSKGEFSISKKGEGKQVFLIGFNDSITATVTGNQLALDSGRITYIYEDITIRLMLSNNKATLEGKQLTWDTDIMAIGTYHSYSANGDGHLSLIATKNDKRTTIHDQ